MSEQTENYGMEVLDVADFNFDGYQVVRGEFFAHLHEPSITFNHNKVGVNTACVKKLPDYDFVQILVNPDKKMLVVRPCQEDEKDSFRWCTTSTKKRAPKQITCRMFFAKVFTLMEWNPNHRYKLIGKLIKSGSDYLFLFDLNNVEIYERDIKDDGTAEVSKTPLYPESWQNQFGTPVNEHRKALQVAFFDEYAVFGLQKDPKPVKKTAKTEDNTATEKEETYEQLNFASANDPAGTTEQP